MELQIEHRSGEHRWVLLDAARHIVGELNYAVTNDEHWRIRYVEVEPFFKGEVLPNVWLKPFFNTH